MRRPPPSLAGAQVIAQVRDFQEPMNKNFLETLHA